MSDIVAELRERALRAEQDGEPIALLDEAAGEIEKLRSWVRIQDAVIHRGNVAALTDAEREAVRFCVTASLPETEKLGGVAGELCRMHAARLRGLLERPK